MKSLKLRIKKMVQKGFGVGYAGKLVIFVPYSVPGDLVKINIKEQKKDYAFGEIEDVIEPSPLRTDPFCPYFPDCGGCQWQMIDYKAQLKLKKDLIYDAMNHIGGINNLPLQDTQGMEIPFHYRNKVQFPLKRLKNRKIIMGFYRYNTHYIVDIEKCPLHLEQFQNVLSHARRVLQEERVTIYDEEKDWGKLRNLTLRGSSKTDEILIVLVTRRKMLSRTLAEKLRAGDSERVVGVVENLNEEKTNRIFGSKNFTLWGRPYYYEQILGLKFIISATSFFQVNTPMISKMAQEFINELKDINHMDHIVDAYSGVGLFSLLSSSFAKRVTGVEISPPAVKDAFKNVEINEQMNVIFRVGDAEEILPELEKPDILILDPPRKGISPNVVKFINSTKPPYIFYISCNPPTLARDTKILIGNGYDIEYIKPYDFFPHTFHVETFTKFVLKGGK